MWQPVTSTRQRLGQYAKNLILGLLTATSAHAMDLITDIEFANVADRSLMLDLYLPEQTAEPALIVWLHGGAWRFGNRANPQILEIVDEGFALASIDFRNSPEAPFPAQMHDIKAAIRFLRAKAEDYGYARDSIAVWGYSSGGHLAALTGTSNGNASLEGDLGEFITESSDVQAIIDYSGPTNFATILNQSTPHGLSVREPALELLLGRPADAADVQALSRLASPVNHVGSLSPPILIMHGLQDNQVPINQSLELEDLYRQHQRQVEVNWLLEGEHTTGEYFHAPYIQQVADFLHRHLQAQ